MLTWYHKSFQSLYLLIYKDKFPDTLILQLLRKAFCFGRGLAVYRQPAQ